jgi:CheY-like chemotaxis protein
MKKVLLVDDMETCHNYLRANLEGHAILLSAKTLQEGRDLFAENPDVAVIVMDGCVEVKSTGAEDEVIEPDTLDLVQEFRETFKGPMIALSQQFNEQLVEAGCDHEVSFKPEAPAKIIKILEEMD